MSEMSFDQRPAVVFVDDARWYSFLQLAAILRRAGFRTVRVSVGRAMWRPENLLFSRNVFLAAPPSPEQLAEILAKENVVDLQPTERLAQTSYSALDLLPQRQRSDIWAGRSTILDKLNNATFFRELGLRTPESLPVELTPVNETVARLMETGRTLIEALHIRGLICFDIIRDSNDVDWIHDVNPRVFGGLTTCQLAGFDFRGAYLRCLGVGVDVQTSPPDTPNSVSFGFPEGKKDLLRSAPYRVSWVRTLRWIWSHWRLLGSRYFLVFIIDRPVTASRRFFNRSEHQR